MMRRALSMLITLGVIMVVTTYYWGYQKTGSLSIDPWLTQAQAAFIPALKKSIDRVTGNAAPANTKVNISTWTDAQGIVHYENRPVDGANILEVDPNKNILPSAPMVDLPVSATTRPKALMDEEMRALRAAKHAQMEAIINK